MAALGLSRWVRRRKAWGGSGGELQEAAGAVDGEGGEEEVLQGCVRWRVFSYPGVRRRSDASAGWWLVLRVGAGWSQDRKHGVGRGRGGTAGRLAALRRVLPRWCSGGGDEV